MSEDLKLSERLSIEIRGWLRPQSLSCALDRIETLCQSVAAEMGTDPRLVAARCDSNPELPRTRPRTLVMRRPATSSELTMITSLASLISASPWLFRIWLGSWFAAAYLGSRQARSATQLSPLYRARWKPLPDG